MSKRSFVTLSETIDGTQDKVHAQLYERALSRFLSYTGMTSDSYRFVELPGSYYDTPSYIAITPAQKPRRTFNVSLAPYWDDNYFAPEATCPFAYTFVSDETETSTLELDSVNYVNGIAKVRSRYTGKELHVNIKDVPEDMQKSDDFGSLGRTFTELIRDNKKGEIVHG